MTGLVLLALGFLIGLGAFWVQLARALPLVELLHRPRALRAMVLAGAGVGCLLLGRRRPASRHGGGTPRGTMSLAVAAMLVAAGAAPVRALVVPTVPADASDYGTCQLSR